MFKKHVKNLSFKESCLCLTNCAVACLFGLLFVFLLLPCFGLKLVQVNSQSMYPNFKVGDGLLVKHTTKLREGDAVCFKDATFGLITHRLVAIVEVDNNTYYLCAGDKNLKDKGIVSLNELTMVLKNNKNLDSPFIDNVLTINNIEGKVILLFTNFNAIINGVKILIILLILLYLNFVLFNVKIKKYLKNIKN